MPIGHSRIHLHVLPQSVILGSMMEMAEKPAPTDESDAREDPTYADVGGDPHALHINAQVGEFRKQLLGMTLRNHLLNCPHGPCVVAQVPIVDELPDAVLV